MKQIPFLKKINLHIKAFSIPAQTIWMICILIGCVGLNNQAPTPSQIAKSANTTISPEGIIRTVLESHTDSNGDEFRLVLTTYPPGVGLPSHHHLSVAFNYILEGVAVSQYAGEPIKTFRAGDTFQDKANDQHLVFRNADKTKPLKYLIAYTTKKGQSFLLVP